MQKKLKKTLSLLFLLLIVILFSFNKNINSDNKIIEPNSNKIPLSENTANTSISNHTKYTVIRVVDGDTVKINFNGKEESVRLIGVDTPESVHPNSIKNTEFGKKASEFTKNYLAGKDITLEFDVQERDKYGRLLAYLYINGEMFNKILLQEGYAQVSTYPPNVKYVDEFTKIQENARNNKKGMWGF